MTDITQVSKSPSEKIMTDAPSVWQKLSRIDVSDHTETKNGFTYLSWAWAWQTLKDNYPDATFEKHVNEKGHPFFSDESGTGFVRVTVTAGGESKTEMFPVLDHKNNAITSPNAMQVNTALQRGLTKAISYLGLGAYVYAGEDLPPIPTTVEVHGVGGEKKQAEGAAQILKIMETFLPSMKKVEDLENFWRDNKTTIELLKRSDEMMYARLLQNFTKRKDELK